MKRKRIPLKKSKRDFTKKAISVNKKNISPKPMRGGIRL